MSSEKSNSWRMDLARSICYDMTSDAAGFAVDLSGMDRTPKDRLAIARGPRHTATLGKVWKSRRIRE